jgi:hypothetical protein
MTMAKKHVKKQDVINGRISLLFFWLVLLAGILWLERFARYRYDLILRHWLPWLLPALTVAAAGTFAFLLIRWIKKGKPCTDRLFSPSFVMLFPATLAIAFFLPWIMDFIPGWQFFRLGCELALFGFVGGYIGYISHCFVGRTAIPLCAALTADVLVLYYMYKRFLFPGSFILTTAEFGFLTSNGAAALLLTATAAVTAAAWWSLRKEPKPLPMWVAGLPWLLTVLALALPIYLPDVLGLFGMEDPFGINAVRGIIFGSLGTISAWFILWSVLKKKNIL